MKELKYNLEFDNDVIIKHIDRIINQIFKLLPSREEGADWEASLKSLILEVVGLKRLWLNQEKIFSLLCRLEALSTLTEEDDFLIFRKLVFECLNLCSLIKKDLQTEEGD